MSDIFKQIYIKYFYLRWRKEKKQGEMVGEFFKRNEKEKRKEKYE